MVSSNSAAGILSLLEDEDSDIQSYALSQLDLHVAQFWPEISDSLTKIEIIYENAGKGQTKDMAALVISKVYFYLGDFDEALNFALNAGDLFQVDQVDGDQYVETIISQCIDKYIQLRSEAGSSVASTSKTPPSNESRLQAIVEKMLDRCIKDQEYKQAIGIALESRRLDVLEQILSSKDSIAADPTLLSYVLHSTMTLLTKLDLRNQVLNMLVALFKQTKPLSDYFSMTQCFVYLNDSQQACAMLNELTKDESSEEKVLIALQVAFDLADTATQEFLGSVRKGFGRAEPSEAPSTLTTQINQILTGTESIRLYLEFLYKNNKADLLILKGSKDVLEGRNSVFHSAITFANAFTNAGTTSDLFLRENLDWLGKASNWSKFSATAALGVIHKGNLTQAMDILSPYLPAATGTNGSTSVFSEGGSLYALGLVNANHGSAEVLDYLKSALKNNQNETILHGAALGLGVAGMATGDEEIYEELRTALYNDNAVAGEAAGYAMGLIMLGTGSQRALDEMLQYAHETQHEKIIRGLAIGLSFLMYGKQEEADGLIETLTADKDPILRYGGIYTIALAYAGTGNSKAIRKLLHVAVSDVNDDVRRAAVIALGFLLFRTPSQVPRIVQLLSESYNPNVRFGATLALGISCAGTGLEDAIDLLEPMTKDPVDFVRQGACVSLAMILIQQNETLNPKVKSTRALFEKMIKDKHEDAMAKLGATMAQGLIDAGGRNVTISMQSKSGSSNMPAIVGLVLFTQFWYWFPLAHCASLAFTPTAIIGVDKDLKLPKFEFTSNVKPSIFAYQPKTAPPKKEAIEKVATAVLSTTAKTSARAKAKEREEKGADAMETDEKAATDTNPSSGAEAMQTDPSSSVEKTDTSIVSEEKKVDENSSSTIPSRRSESQSQKLPNLSRVVPAQLPYVDFSPESRFQPVRPLIPSQKAYAKPNKSKGSSPAAAAILAQSSASLSSLTGGGIFVLRDSRPTEQADYLELEAVKAIEDGQPAPANPTSAQADNGLNADMLQPIAEMPPSFEYPFGQD